MDYGRRPSLLGPALLIGLGILLLLQNMGYLPFGFWATAWRLWPVVLVMVGLDLLLGRRSGVGGLIAFGLIVALGVGALVLAGRIAGAQQGQLEPVTVRQAVGEAERGEVRLEFGAGELLLDRAESSRYLVDGTAVAVTQDYRLEDGTARLALRHVIPQMIVLPFVGDPAKATWDLGLTGSIPLDLRVKTGAGQAVVDLTGLKLENLDLTLGVGQAQVTFPAEGRLQAAVSGGIGELVITLPEGLPARLTISTGIGDVSAPSSFVRRNNVYETPDFSTAGDYLDLTLSLGIGHVVVK